VALPLRVIIPQDLCTVAINQDTVNRVYKRAGYKCEICLNRHGKPELHHALIHRSKKHPEYDHEINMQVTCKPCHELYANSYENQKAHYARVCAYYGKSVVEDWVNSLGLRSRQFWD